MTTVRRARHRSFISFRPGFLSLVFFCCLSARAIASPADSRTVGRKTHVVTATGRRGMHAMLAACTLLAVAASSSDPWPAAASAVADETPDSYTTAYLNVTCYDAATGDVIQSDKSEIGKFGEYHVGAANGVLLHVIGADGDRNGCASPVHGAPAVPPASGPWIALVRRGKCSFQTKVDNARRAGASAVIVYNDRDNADLDKMKLQPSDPSEYAAPAAFAHTPLGRRRRRLPSGPALPALPGSRRRLRRRRDPSTPSPTTTAKSHKPVVVQSEPGSECAVV